MRRYLILPILALALVGCSQSAIRTYNETLQAPANRHEAVTLMRELDMAALDSAWETEALRIARRRMTGRLLGAGLSAEEIEQWIVASPRSGPNSPL